MFKPGLALLVALAVAHCDAKAHQAPSGWEYPPECCSGADCAQIADVHIAEAPGGYRVRVPPGGHPMVPLGGDPVNRFIPHGDNRIRPSGDGRKHACLGPAGAVYCLFIPPGGV